MRSATEVDVPKKAATPKPKKAAKARSAKPAKKPPAKAKAAKPAAKAKPASKATKAAAPKPAPKPAAKPAPADAKSGRKGITIVTPKPPKKVKVPVTAASFMPPGLTPLLDPKNPNRKPLIPSGPKAASVRALGQHGGPEAEAPKPVTKTHLGKKELEHFRTLLLKKRQELVGDVSEMERQALQGESGSLSNMPSHIAEQGSDASEQSLSLDLAAADRRLIKEIDEALKRIDAGTYGVCEATGKPIRTERLEELPWARYSIEAARELERHAMRA
jgi:DnaK suppressor protein